MDSSLYERTMASEITNKMVTERNEGLTALHDSYILEFLYLPENLKEKDLRKAIVGYRDFFIDLLLFNRELHCLVAIELKIGEFQPEHLSKMEFYLEVLDHDVKKADENPSVYVVLRDELDWILL